MARAFLKRCSICAITLWLLLSGVVAQTVTQSTAFTYQGKLTDNGSSANGAFDLQFRLFDTSTVGSGTQQGATLSLAAVLVTGGIFTVQLDFGAVFDGSARYLETAVRPAGDANPHTILSPRQEVTSSPYTIRSLSAATADSALNATQLGGLPSAGFIQNTSSQQAATNFNISGDGTAGGTLSANILNATTQFNIDGSRVLSTTGANNLFAGALAGNANMTGTANSFFGSDAAFSNTDGSYNSIFGAFAGASNTTGNSNALFGKESNLPDLGLIAEEVAAVDPLLVTRNHAGEIQGVKYDQLTVVLINAIKQDQAQLNHYQVRLQQQSEIDALKKLVCLDHPNAGLCN